MQRLLTPHSPPGSLRASATGRTFSPTRPGPPAPDANGEQISKRSRDWDWPWLLSPVDLSLSVTYTLREAQGGQHRLPSSFLSSAPGQGPGPAASLSPPRWSARLSGTLLTPWPGPVSPQAPPSPPPANPILSLRGLRTPEDERGEGCQCPLTRLQRRGGSGLSPEEPGEKFEAKSGGWWG